MIKNTKQHCEYLRHQAKTIFDKVRGTWCDALRWAAPHRGTWILSQTQGERKNQHIVDGTHLLALRSFVAGFLEGNTSASTPWVRAGTRDADRNKNTEAKAWLQHFTSRVLAHLSSSNFYNAAGIFYYDYGVVNTGAHYFEMLQSGGFFVHTLIPGAYSVIDNAYGEATIMVREFTLNVKAVVDKYGKNGDWSNISKGTRKMYEDGNYTELVDIVHIIQPNSDFDVENPDDPNNLQWLELTYELGAGNGTSFSAGQNYGQKEVFQTDNKFLKRFTQKRKPFVVGKSTEQFEYGEKGPTLAAMGLIKSLNKKAISKDEALDQILQPALQGPSSLRKSYISTASNTFVPIDSRAIAAGQKLETIFQVNPAIGALTADVEDLRQQVDKFFFADYLLYLSKNPKTRTATETDAIVEEQQRVVGPNLQSLNFTYNTPVVEYAMDYVLYEDPYLEPIPEVLQGQRLKPEFVSIFAQAAKAADLPAVDRYISMVANVAQFDPKILQKANTDMLADIYEDRLYLPEGLNNGQEKVDAIRAQAQKDAQRQQAMEQTIPAMAKAAKDASAASAAQAQQ